MVTKKKTAQIVLKAAQLQLQEVADKAVKLNFNSLDLVSKTGEIFKKVSTGEEMHVEYGNLAVAVAQMLKDEGIDELGTPALGSVTAPWSTNVAPLVSILTRVHTVYLAVVEDRPEAYRGALERLWAALAARCEEVNGHSFESVVGEALGQGSAA